MSKTIRRRCLGTVSGLALVAAGLVVAASNAYAADTNPDNPDIEIVVVTAARGKAANIAPTKSSLDTQQPTSIMTRTFIEDSVADVSDYSAIATISPSVSSGVDNNGPGLSEKDAVIRGFKDGLYNVRYDDIPFGDTNDPSHHSTSYFPASTVGAMQIDRGPGQAGDLGQASLGGSMNLYSRTLTDDFYLQQKITYGSWNTRNLVTTIQSGVLPDLNNTRITANFQELQSDGALSYAKVKQYNQFLKLETPLGPNWTLTFLATHNSGQIHQPDNDGITLAQERLYGKNFSMSNDPSSPTYWGYNTTKKQTDFEYLRVQGEAMPGLMIEDTGYTYAYINHTYSVWDSTQSENDILAGTYPDWGTYPVSYKGPHYPTNVAGYDKLNAYRVWGNIVRASKDFDFDSVSGQVRAGFWYEISETDRHRYDRDWTLGFVPDYREKPPKNLPAGVPVPDASIQFFERSSWTHYEPFIDVDIRPLKGLIVTPGLKYVSLTRKIAAPVGSKTRLPQYTSTNYHRLLPSLSANYKIHDNWAIYAQYAQGFLIPPLKAFYVNDPRFNTVKPMTSNTYQIGTVYNVNNFNFDADIYYVRAADYFQKETIPGTTEKAYVNDGTVDFKGIEAEGTYAFTDGALNGLAVFANGSLNQAEGVNPGTADYHHQIKNVPKWTAAFGLIYRKNNIRVSLINKINGEQWADSGEPATYKIPAYNITNLVVGYVFDKIKLQAGVYNLFNDRSVTDISVNNGLLATDPAAANDQYWWVPERSYQITMRITLD